MKKNTPAANILVLDKLIYKALDLELYNTVKIYCTEIINATTMLERSAIESGV